MSPALNHLLQGQALSAVATAKAEGVLSWPKACEACGRPNATGREGKTHVWHHHDYAKPLDVIPLCRPCHGRVHSGTLVEPRTGRMYPRPIRPSKPEATTISLRVEAALLDRIERRAVACTRDRGRQLIHLLKAGISLERLPEVEPSGDGDSYESAHAYRERLQLILDVA